MSIPSTSRPHTIRLKDHCSYYTPPPRSTAFPLEDATPSASPSSKSHAQPVDYYRGADKSLARPGRKQATATEYFEFHTSYL